MLENEHHRNQGQGAPSRSKRLGGYLVEAGLLTPAQIDVALNDQKMTGMRFGEILAARGWVKQQTIEYLMQKVILPEQAALKRQRPAGQVSQSREQSHNKILAETASASHLDNQLANQRKQPARRDIPISKPLPSVPKPEDDDVSWVG
jgi:hypothetical protein